MIDPIKRNDITLELTRQRNILAVRGPTNRLFRQNRSDNLKHVFQTMATELDRKIGSSNFCGGFHLH